MTQDEIFQLLPIQGGPLQIALLFLYEYFSQKWNYIDKKMIFSFNCDMHSLIQRYNIVYGAARIHLVFALVLHVGAYVGYMIL